MAGILDGYQFDPQAYGGGGGMGLLGLLAQQYGLPFPAQAPQGFAAPKGDYLGSAAGYAPTDYAPQGPPAPPLGPPIDVPSLQVAGAGGYPSDAQLPPTSTPTAGTGLLGGNLFSGGASPAGPAPGAGQQPGIPAQPVAAGPGIGDRLGAFWQGLGQGGLTSAVGGLATGQRQDPQGLLERALVQRGVSPEMARAGVKNPTLLPTLLSEMGQNATYQALVQAGVPPGAAQAAALNPEVLKTIAPQLYSKPTFTQIGEDAFGNKQYGFVQPDKMTVTPADAAAAGGTTGGTSGFLAPGVRQIDSTLAGQDYLKQFSPEVQAAVKDYVEGRSMPTGNPRKGFTQTVKMIAQKYGNDIGMPADDIAFAQRKKVATDFASGGNSAKNVKSLETIGGHLDKMMTIFDQLGNTWQPEYNTVGNWISQKLGSGKVNAYETVANGVANELGTVFRSSGMSDAEVKSWRDRISASNSPEQFQASMRTLLDMLKTRKEALQEQYSNPVTGLGRPLPKESFQNLDAAISKIEGKFAPGQAAPQQGTTSQQQGTPAAAAPNLPKPPTPADAAKLPSGTHFLDSNGVERIRP